MTYNNDEGFTLKPALYEKLRFASQILIPAISTLYFTIGTIWELPAVDKVVGTLAAVAVFLGALVGLSRKNYNAAEKYYDGTVTLIPNEEGTLIKLNLVPEDLIGKKQVLLKLGPPTVSDPSAPFDPDL